MIRLAGQLYTCKSQQSLISESSLIMDDQLSSSGLNRAIQDAGGRQVETQD
jgi:hypothetical protein